MGLSIDEFMNIVWKNKNVSVLLKTLNDFGYLFIGFCSIDQDSLDKHAKLIMQIVFKVAKYYHKIMKRNLDDLLDDCLDCIISKCGAIFINSGNDLDYLKSSLYNYLQKYMVTLRSQQIEYSNDNLHNLICIDDEENEQDQIFLDEYFYLSNEEKYFLSRMSFYIETRGSYFNELAKEFDLSLNEIKNRILEIKEKILDYQTHLEPFKVMDLN